MTTAPPTDSTREAVRSALRIERGTAYALFAFDIGLAIDLAQAERRITDLTQRDVFKHRRRAPQSFQVQPAPLRVTRASEPVGVGKFETGPSVDCVLFDFGGVSVTYSVPLRGGLPELLALSNALYDHAGLQADARRQVEALLAAVLPAVQKANIAPAVEDYVVFHVAEWSPAGRLDELIAANRLAIAQVLRSEAAELSDQEVADALACRISYGQSDAALIDWNGALLLDPDADDVRTVLEFANVELLESRFLDQQLDTALDESWQAVTRRRRMLLGSYGRDLQRVARLQADAAFLFEGINNALKLVGDQYLARVYRLASQRFHLPEWDAAILRKIESLESIYDKLSDQAAGRRMEILEWIIIFLIAVSIALPMLWTK